MKLWPYLHYLVWYFVGKLPAPKDPPAKLQTFLASPTFETQANEALNRANKQAKQTHNYNKVINADSR